MTSSPKIIKSIHFKSLDLLRAFAALSVITYHVIELSAWKTFPSEGFFSFFRYGWIGVDIFFVISGFVVAISYFNLSDRPSFMSLYIKRRLARIVPLHYLTMIVFITFIAPNIFLSTPLEFIKNLGSHLVFIHNIFPSTHGSINGVNWSLATEMQFYLLIFFLGGYIKKIRKTTLIFSTFLIAIFYRFLIAHSVTDDSNISLVFIKSTQLPGMLDEFGVGLLMAKLYFENPEIFKTNITLNFLISIGLLAILYLFFNHFYFSLYQNFYCHIFFRSLLSIFLFFFIFSLNGLFLKFHENDFLSKLFNPFIFLGKISYGLYLWHLPIILSLTKINSLNSVSIFFLTIGLTILFSAISYFYFELPIINKYRS